MSAYGTLLVGLAAAALGGELFVRGLIGLSRWMQLPTRIVGVTLAAFATSSAELSVSVNSALQGIPEIGLGDALGSNVVNVGLILGLAVLISSIKAPRLAVRRDFLVAGLAPIATAGLAIDGLLSRADGIVLLAIFAAWAGFTINDARRHRDHDKVTLAARERMTVAVSCAAGLVVLVIAGRLVALGGEAAGNQLGISPFIIGAIVVALGTSTPELATMLVAALRRQQDIGLGTTLGSNIFNNLLIVSVTTIIHPIPVSPASVSIAAGFGTLVVLGAFPRPDGIIARWQGILLIALYGGYFTATFSTFPLSSH